MDPSPEPEGVADKEDEDNPDKDGRGLLGPRVTALAAPLGVGGSSCFSQGVKIDTLGIPYRMLHVLTTCR